MSAGRRFLDRVPRLIGRAPADYGVELEDYLKKNHQAVTEGIPAGFKDTAPGTIQAGATAAAGTENASWMAADATFHVETAVSIGLSNDNTEGTGTSLLRADAHIKRDVRVQSVGADVGTRNAISFSSEFSVTDNPGNDRVDVAASPTLASIIEDAIFYASFVGG